MTIEPALKKRKLDAPAVASTEETGPVEAGSIIEQKETDGNQIKESKRSKKGQNKVKSGQNIIFLSIHNFLNVYCSPAEQRSERYVTIICVKPFTTALQRHQFARSRSVNLYMTLKST